MKLTIDTDSKKLTVHDEAGVSELDLYSKEAFEKISRQWVKVGWNEKYSYTFSWFGRPIIQLPEDIVRIQEVIYQVQPDVIIETGVAHGGSLIFYAGLCKAMEKGRVIGIDIDIRAHNRKAIEAHFLAPLITLVEGSSVDPDIVAQVKKHIKPGDKVLVLLDSDHTRAHVLKELLAYHDVVTPGSYIVATDGVMAEACDVPRGTPGWNEDHPANAALDFAKLHPEFVIEQPAWPFNESALTDNITYWPSAYLRRLP